MKKIVRAAVAAAVLSAGAVSPAFADLELPSTGNSQGALTVFDSLNQRSIVVSLNVNFNNLLPSVMNQEAGYSITNAVNASDQSELAAFIALGGELTWWVSAADSAGAGLNGGRQIMTTGAAGLTPSQTSFTNQGVRQAADAANNFYTRVNTVCGTDDTCFADAEAETPDDFAAYAGNSWGARWNTQLPAGLANGTAVGIAQAFYLFSTPESATANGAVQATRTVYGNSLGFGSWNLSSLGVLSYSLAGASAVPLPAAAWLLISGLVGLATVGRRRQTGAAVAA